MNIAWYFQRTWRQIFKVAQDGLFIAHAQVRWASLLFEAKNSALFYKFGIVLWGILGLFRMDFRSIKRPKFSHCSHYSFTSFFNFHSTENGGKTRAQRRRKKQRKWRIFGKKSRSSHCNLQESNQKMGFIFSMVFHPLFSPIYNVFQ